MSGLVGAKEWLFSLQDLEKTPSVTTSHIDLAKELYDRARGIEFLYRLGTSLHIPNSALFTAATWFHRFYMRCSLEDHHRQDVAAACVFLATKTEECGRKLKDVARIAISKTSGREVDRIPDDSKEVEYQQNSILQAEETLLEMLCFDFIVDSPHAMLTGILDAAVDEHAGAEVQDYAWNIAHDSFRTPLCILYPPRIIAAAAYILAQRLYAGPNSPSFEARISSSAPSSSLPTPPSNKAPSPDQLRFAVDHLALNDQERSQVSCAISMLLDFYGTQNSTMPLVANIVSPVCDYRPMMNRGTAVPTITETTGLATGGDGRTPTSSYGGNTPAAPKTPSQPHPSPDGATKTASSGSNKHERRISGTARLDLS